MLKGYEEVVALVEQRCDRDECYLLVGQSDISQFSSRGYGVTADRWCENWVNALELELAKRYGDCVITITDVDTGGVITTPFDNVDLVALLDASGVIHIYMNVVIFDRASTVMCFTVQNPFSKADIINTLNDFTYSVFEKLSLGEKEEVTLDNLDGFQIVREYE